MNKFKLLLLSVIIFHWAHNLGNIIKNAFSPARYYGDTINTAILFTIYTLVILPVMLGIVSLFSDSEFIKKIWKEKLNLQKSYYFLFSVAFIGFITGYTFKYLLSF